MCSDSKPKSLTSSQKRRARLRRTAIRHSQWNTQQLKVQIGLHQSCSIVKYERSELLACYIPPTLIDASHIPIKVPPMDLLPKMSESEFSYLLHGGGDHRDAVFARYVLPVVGEDAPGNVSSSPSKREISFAQEKAVVLREAELNGSRRTFEDTAFQTSIGAPDVPGVLSSENLGDFVLGHLDIACRLFSDVHRRPYMQQQIHRLTCKHLLSAEAESLVEKILDNYAPDFQIGGGLRFMCSRCGALYETQVMQCLVCQGYDIFDASAYDRDSDSADTEEEDAAQAVGRGLHIKSPGLPAFMRSFSETRPSNVHHRFENVDHQQDKGRDRHGGERGSALVAGRGCASIEPSPPPEAAQSIETPVTDKPIESYYAVQGGPHAGVYTS